MKLKLLLSVVAAASLMLSACDKGKSSLKSVKEKASYSIGQQFGQNLAQVAEEIDMDALVQGMRDTVKGKKPLLTKEEGQAVMQEFQAVIQQAMAKKKEGQSTQNAADAAKFLEENKKAPGVKVTGSGLQYTVEKEGTGPRPAKSDTVKVHYRGTLLNGEEFDSSYTRGEPVTFPVTGVIPGWTEALQLMKTGSKYKLFIPPALGYGEQGAGQKIGPNAALIFEVELLDIVKKK